MNPYENNSTTTTTNNSISDPHAEGLEAISSIRARPTRTTSLACNNRRTDPPESFIDYIDYKQPACRQGAATDKDDGRVASRSKSTRPTSLTDHKRPAGRPSYLDAAENEHIGPGADDVEDAENTRIPLQQEQIRKSGGDATTSDAVDTNGRNRSLGVGAYAIAGIHANRGLSSYGSSVSSAHFEDPEAEVQSAGCGDDQEPMHAQLVDEPQSVLSVAVFSLQKRKLVITIGMLFLASIAVITGMLLGRNTSDEGSDTNTIVPPTVPPTMSPSATPVPTQKVQKLCPPTCEPEGTCVPCLNALDQNCVGEFCRCNDGYGGDDCSLLIQTCPPSQSDQSLTECYNGGDCVAKEIFADEMGLGGAEQIWRCDCTTAMGMAKTGPRSHEGLQCEFPATQSCMLGGSLSAYAFCVNGGECVRKITSNEEHPGCICSDDYEGRHCQYEKGTAPP